MANPYGQWDKEKEFTFSQWETAYIEPAVIERLVYFSGGYACVEDMRESIAAAEFDGGSASSQEKRRRQDAVALTLNAGFDWLDGYDRDTRTVLAEDLVDQIDRPLTPFEQQLQAFTDGTLNMTAVAVNFRRRALQERAARLADTATVLNANEVLHISVEQPGPGEQLVVDVVEMNQPLRMVG